MTKNYRTTVVICLICLFFFNLLATSSLAPQLFLKQLISWFIGFLLFYLAQNINLNQFKYYSLPIIIVVTIFLLIPTVFGSSIRGSKRWINLGPISIQPSEYIKPIVASLLAATENHLLLIPPTLVTLVQPDLGTAIAIFTMIIPFFFFNQTVRKHLIVLAIFMLVSSPLIWQFGLKPYQRSRVISFLNPQADPLGKGYNLIQSQIAIGSAGFWGKGYKQGTQGQLLFLPEKHSDFIFAAMTEEFGAIGCIFLVGIYFTLIKTLINKAYQSQISRQYFLYTLIIATQIWAQAFINIGMNIGILPITGTPLPFMSVGGSSIITLLLSLGIVFAG